MFERTLVTGAKNALAILGKSGLLKDAYLAGGTAAALQLGHPVSIDFDFFTDKKFDPKEISRELKELGSFSVEQDEKGTLTGKFNEINFSIFLYKYPVIFPLKKYLLISISDIRDIAAMKLDAVSNRGAKRDFIDLYFICKSGYKIADVSKLIK
ncbi:MAG: nucleotidyl transferase AbiEii/AbiGii toxin family protein [bacterium]